MHDAVTMTVVQRTGDLASEFSGLLLLQFAMRDDVVKHLTTIHVFKEHIPMVGSAHNIIHATDIWMIEKRYNSRFPRGTNFL